MITHFSPATGDCIQYREELLSSVRKLNDCNDMQCHILSNILQKLIFEYSVLTLWHPVIMQCEQISENIYYPGLIHCENIRAQTFESFDECWFKVQSVKSENEMWQLRFCNPERLCHFNSLKHSMFYVIPLLCRVCISCCIDLNTSDLTQLLAAFIYVWHFSIFTHLHENCSG